MAADTRRTIASRFQGYWHSHQGAKARFIRNNGGLTDDNETHTCTMGAENPSG
jgi:hypothetical protein